MFFKIVQLVCVLAAASILGNWYMKEYRRIRATSLPWYRAHLTLPGVLIILLIILLPVIARHI